MLSSMWYDWDNFDQLMRRAFETVNVHTRKTEDGVGYEFDLPGVKAEDIDVTAENGVLTVKAERNGRSMIRTITIPRSVDVDKAEARYENGVLQLAFPFAESAKPRRIEVGTSRKELT